MRDCGSVRLQAQGDIVVPGIGTLSNRLCHDSAGPKRPRRSHVKIARGYSHSDGVVVKLSVALPAFALILAGGHASAHHSFAASFTTDEIVREGVVNRYVFRNPHVIIFMSVENESGEQAEWMAEGSAATSLRRAGWSADTIQPGELVRISGNAGRDGKLMISMEHVEVLDSDSLAVLRTPSMSGAPTEVAAGENVSIPLHLADGRPNLTGAWTRGRDGPGFRNHRLPPFNEAGAALQAEWDPINDPQVACEDPGLIRQAGFTPHPVRIEQYDDHVVISYEEYGGVRTIYFDDRDITDEYRPLGQSVARYEGDTLVIESTHLPANPTGTPGHRLSDQATTVETYRRLDDPTQGPMVEMEMIIVDPDYLTEPWEMVWKKLYTEGYEFIPVECYAPY